MGTGRSGLFSDIEDPVAFWQAIAVPGIEDSQVAIAQQWRWAEIIEPREKGQESMRAKTVLDSGADISSIPVPLC